MTTIAARYAAVLERVRQAAERAGRQPAEITLVAVTKTWPAEVVLAAYEAGMRHFGENRPEELAEKRAAVEAVLGDGHGITWHQIGTVQSRKTALVAECADVFHALDRLKIARRLSRQLLEDGRTSASLPIFLEVNVSGESSKSGFVADRWESSATQREELRIVLETIIALPGLRPSGLMTMAPWDAPAEQLHAVFRRTRQLAEWLGATVPAARLEHLSMGMTDDFEIAIEEGATHIRVGRALFGSR